MRIENEKVEGQGLMDLLSDLESFDKVLDTNYIVFESDNSFHKLFKANGRYVISEDGREIFAAKSIENMRQYILMNYKESEYRYEEIEVSPETIQVAKEVRDDAAEIISSFLRGEEE